MRLVLTTVMGLTLLAASTPTHAAGINSSDLGYSTGDVTFNGYIGGAVVPGLTSSFNFTLNSVNTVTNTWEFGYSISNTSSNVAPGVIDASRIIGFGFNTTPELNHAGTSIDGSVFDSIVFGANIPGNPPALAWWTSAARSAVAPAAVAPAMACSRARTPRARSRWTSLAPGHRST